VRQAQKNNVAVRGDPIGIHLLQLYIMRGKDGVYRTHCLARIAFGYSVHNFDFTVPRQQAHQLSPCIPVAPTTLTFTISHPPVVIYNYTLKCLIMQPLFSE
jgi:hypothetical protein